MFQILVTMENAEDQELDVRKDLHHLTCTLTSEGLKPEVMFAKKRGIRSCTPPLNSSANGHMVHERLSRVPLPEEKEE